MSNATIFFISLFLSTAVLLLERTAGLGITFHPDSLTYLTRSQDILQAASVSPSLIPNHGYYFVSAFLGENPNYLITLNMVLFATTNVILHSAFRTAAIRVAPETLNKGKYFLLYFLLLFSLYRLHLSVHVLKDTAITLLVVLMVYFGAVRGAVLVPFLALFRLFGVAYIILFLNGRALYAAFVIFGVIAIASGQVDSISSLLLDWNDKDFNFRQGAEVPSFQGYGLAGVALRMIVWPVLLLSGFFLFLAPSPLLAPIALSSFILQFWGLIIFRRPVYTLSAFGLLAVIAALVPGFTTYQRYCLPIITVLPILFLRVRLRRSKIDNKFDTQDNSRKARFN